MCVSFCITKGTPSAVYIVVTTSPLFIYVFFAFVYFFVLSGHKLLPSKKDNKAGLHPSVKQHCFITAQQKPGRTDITDKQQHAVKS